MRITESTSAVNSQGIQRTSNYAFGKAEKADGNNNTGPNRDRVSISDFGRNSLGKKNKANSLLQSLMEQKQSIMENRNNLIQGAAERGEDLTMIKDQLEAIDEQLKAVDEQISKAMIEDQQKAVGIDKKKEGTAKTSPMTQEEMEMKELSDMIALGGDLTKMQNLSDTKDKMNRNIKVLQSEIKQDGALDSGNSGRNAAFKREQVAEIEKKVSELDGKIGESINEVNEKAGDKPTYEIKESDEIEKQEEL